MSYNGVQEVTTGPLAFVFDFEYFASEMGYNGLQRGTTGYKV